MKDYKNPRELLEYIQKAAELNPDYTTQEILEAALERGDTLWWVKVTDIIEQNDDFATSLVEAINKPAKEIDLSGLDLSFEEPKEISDSASIIESNWWEAIDKKELWSERNYDVLKNLYDRYMQLLSAKKDLITKYNWWKWLPTNSEKRTEYEKQLKILNDWLKEIEDWDELYNIISSIKEVWLWEKPWDNDSRAAHWLNVMMSKNSEDNEPRWWLKQNLFWNKMDDYMWYGFEKSFDSAIDDYLKTHKWSKDTKDTKDTKVNNNISVNWPFKPMNPTDEKVTDEMSFGSWVKWAGGNQYLEERNKSLALHLKMKWIETPEEIDAYLSKYPSWKEAKQEWKDNTLNILSDKISNMKWWIVSWKKWEEEKEKNIEWKGKAREVKDRKNLDEKKWKAREVKDKKRLWDDWTPDNDSSINWIDEKENNTLRADEYKKNWYKVKWWKFYTPDWELVESNWYNLSDKWEWIPVNKNKDKLETAEDWNNFWNSDNDSPINWTEELKTEKDWNNFWNEDQKKESKKQISKPQKTNLKSAKKETKKEWWKKLNIVKWSETIKNLLKKSKK